jgi:predicted dehydrogenase
MVRFGILGLGKIASKFAHDINLVEGVELTAVGSRNLQKAQEFAEKFNASFYYSSYEEVLENPSVDVVYIATPHHIHYKNTMQCLNAGKAVLCEKPFAMKASEVVEMIALAREKDLFLMEALWTRFIPGTIKVMNLLKQGVIGEIKVLKADFGFIVSKERAGRLTDPAMGGGSLLDIGIYPVFLSLLLLGKPEEIIAMAQLHNNTDRQCVVTLKYKESMALLISSFESNLTTAAVIYGSQGSIRMHAEFHQCSRITVSRNDQSEEVYEIPYEGLGYCHEIKEVRDCLNNNQLESSLMRWSDSFTLMDTLDQIMKQIGMVPIH